MPFNVLEISRHSAEPVELYDFSMGVAHWRFTSGKKTVTFGNNEYRPVAMQRGRIVISQNPDDHVLRLTLTRNADVNDMVLRGAPSGPLKLTVYRGHRSDTEFIVLRNYVAVPSSKWRGNQVQFTCESFLSAMRNQTLRRRYSVNCTHDLYGQQAFGCLVNPGNFLIQGAADAISGATVTVNAITEADGYYNGGKLMWDDVDVGLEAAGFILSHTGQNVTLMRQPYSLAVGQGVRLLPGCNRTMSDCDGKFSNSDNYGGHSHWRDQDPFSGVAVF